MPHLVKLLSAPELDIRTEAAWAVNNAICLRTQEHIQCVVSHGAIKALCKFLGEQVFTVTITITTVALEALDIILRVSFGDACSMEKCWVMLTNRNSGSGVFVGLVAWSQGRVMIQN